MDPRVNKQSLDISELISAAEQGDPRAQSNLGWCYYIGNGVAADRIEAVKWYHKAAEQGLREAKEMLELLQANSVSTGGDQSEQGRRFGQGPKEGLTPLKTKAKRLRLLLVWIMACLLVMLVVYSVSRNTRLWPKTSDEKRVKPTSSSKTTNLTVEDVNEDRTVDSVIMNELARFSQKWLDVEPDVNAAGED